MPAAGKYRTSVSVERTRPELSKAGSTVDVWSGWLQRRAKVRLAFVREQTATNTQNTVLISHVVELRRDAQTEQILQEMRVRILSRAVDGIPRVLHIESIVEADDQGRELQLRCTERAVPQ